MLTGKPDHPRSRRAKPCFCRRSLRAPVRIVHDCKTARLVCIAAHRHHDRPAEQAFHPRYRDCLCGLRHHAALCVGQHPHTLVRGIDRRALAVAARYLAYIRGVGRDMLGGCILGRCAGRVGAVDIGLYRFGHHIHAPPDCACGACPRAS